MKKDKTFLCKAEEGPLREGGLLIPSRNEKAAATMCWAAYCGRNNMFGPRTVRVSVDDGATERKYVVSCSVVPVIEEDLSEGMVPLE